MKLRFLKICFTLFLVSHSLLFAQEFKVRLVSDPQTLDWTLATTPMDSQVLTNIMEGLFEFDSKMRLKPLLAQSYTVSDDGKVYTFKIRSGVKWSDGKPLDADDFVYSWQRLLNKLTGAAYAYLLFDIEGAEAYHSGAEPNFSKVGIKRINSSVLQIKLKKSVPYFLQMLTFWVTFPLRKDLVEKFGVQWTKPQNIAVVGPFMPEKVEPSNVITLKRNPFYFGTKPQLSKISMLIVNEDSVALNLFKAGKLDFLMPINFIEVPSLTKNKAYHFAPYYRTHYLGFNTSKYPVNLPNFRKAIGMSIDKAQLSKTMHGLKPAAKSLLPVEIFAEGKDIGLDFDPKAAKALLVELGIDAEKLPPLKMISYASDENALVTQYLQDQIKKNLGLKVEIQLLEFKTFRIQLDLQTSDLFYNSWAADYADPDTYFGVFLSESGNNKSKWSNSDYDEWVKQAATTINPSKRVELYRKALRKILLEETAIFPLHFNAFSYLLNPKFKNFSINPLNYVYFRDIVVSQ